MSARAHAYMPAAPRAALTRPRPAQDFYCANCYNQAFEELLPKPGCLARACPARRRPCSRRAARMLSPGRPGSVCQELRSAVFVGRRARSASVSVRIYDAALGARPAG